MIKLLVSLAIAVLVVALLLRWGGVTVEDVGAALEDVDVAVFALAVGIQAVIYVLRAARLRVLLRAMGSPSVPLGRLTAASAAWIFDSAVLPAKIGEATLVLHLGRLGVKAEHGIVGLLLSRLLDLAMVTAIFGAACVVMGVGGTYPNMPWLPWLGAALLAAAAALGAVIVRGGHALGFVRRGLVRVGLERTIVGTRISRFVTRVEDALHAVRRESLLSATLWSLPLWVFVFGGYAAFGYAVGLTDLSVTDLIFGASIAILGAFVPISGFLGFGMLDLGWAWGFAAVGVPEAKAVTTGLAFHTLYLVGVGILGAIGHALLASRSTAPTGDSSADAGAIAGED